MTAPRQTMLVLFALAALGVGGYFTYDRMSKSGPEIETNAVIEAVLARRATIDAKVDALNSLEKEENLATKRDAIVAAAREAATEAMQVFEQGKLAAIQAHARFEAAKTPDEEKYWRLKRDGISKFAEAQRDASAGYKVWDDPTNPDLKTVRERQSRHFALADAAEEEADDLLAQADALWKRKRGKF